MHINNKILHGLYCQCHHSVILSAVYATVEPQLVGQICLLYEHYHT